MRSLDTLQTILALYFVIATAAVGLVLGCAFFSFLSRDIIPEVKDGLAHRRRAHRYEAERKERQRLRSQMSVISGGRAAKPRWQR